MMRLLRQSLLVAVASILCFAAFPSATPALDLEDALGSELARSSVVEPALLQALANSDKAGARVYYLEPEGYAEPTNRSTLDREVSPVLLDLANAFLPGELSMVESESIRAVRGVVDADVVRRLLDHPNVVGITLDETVRLEPDEPRLGLRGSCVPTSTRACVQGNRFSLEVFLSGTTNVAASSLESAVFWKYSSGNWEVVAKVLNGCSLNGKWWVFAAGATSSGYSLHVLDWTSGASIAYNGAALCPITDTGQLGSPFPCP